MITNLGECYDAFAIRGRGLVLGFILYTDADFEVGQKVIGKIVKNGQVVREVGCELGIVLSGKRHRYDMSPVSLIIGEPIEKSEVVGHEVHLVCDYEFWQPDSSF